MLPPDADIDVRDALRHEMGFDKPILVQYAVYLQQLVVGDFGTSIFHHRPAIRLSSNGSPRHFS
jgi:peptide/nickel transport system permease protein